MVGGKLYVFNQLLQRNTLMAVRKYEKTPVSENKYLVVVYKELKDDGFVITAYFTRKLPKWRKTPWQR